MNIVKSQIHNRINIETLQAILAIQYGLKRKEICCHSYKLPKIVADAIGQAENYKTHDEPGISQRMEASELDLYG